MVIFFEHFYSSSFHYEHTFILQLGGKNPTVFKDQWEQPVCVPEVAAEEVRSLERI